MTVALTAALYTYLFSAFLLPAAGLTLVTLFWQSRDFRRFTEGSAALLLTGLAFLPLARNAWFVNQAESTPGQPLCRFCRQSAASGASRHHLARQTGLIKRPRQRSALFVMLIVLGLVLPFRHIQPNHTDDRIWLWLWLGVPLLIANMLLARSRSIFAQDRYLLFIAPFVLWAAARGIASLAGYARPLGWATGAASALVLASALPVLWTPALAAKTGEPPRPISTPMPRRHRTCLRPSSPTSTTHIAARVVSAPKHTFEELPVFFPFGGTVNTGGRR